MHGKFETKISYKSLHSILHEQRNMCIHTNYKNTGPQDLRNCSNLLFATANVRITEILFFRRKRKLSMFKMPLQTLVLKMWNLVIMRA